MPKAKRGMLRVLHGRSPGDDDRRLFCRFALPRIQVHFKDLKVGDKGAAVCQDIGGGGARFDLDQEVKAHTPLEMWFDLPDGLGPMHLLGKVAWARPEGEAWRAGISFDRQRLIEMSRVMRLQNVNEA
jgi:hypothetical protein